MSSTTVTKYENAVLIPDSQKLITFANAYEVKVIYYSKVMNILIWNLLHLGRQKG